MRPGRPANVTEYWQPEFASGPASVDELNEELHGALASSVGRAMTQADCGAFLSGGLDSSTVSGYFARASEGPAKTFSIGFGVPEYDELQYARIAAQHFGCDAVELDVKADDIIDSFNLIAQHFDEPFGNSSVVPTYCCAKLAKAHGVEVLLAGDGGDELFGGNERYAKQAVFERFYRIPKPLRRLLVEPIADLFHPEDSPFPLRKLKSYVDQARIQLPHRLVSWNFAFREGVGALLTEDFAHSVNGASPREHMQMVYDSFDSGRLLDRFLVYDWRITLADNDLRKVGQMCALAGVEVTYPMLDDAVVDVSLRVPAELKMQNNSLRSFYKNAMRGFLPDEILTKPKHGFGLPFGVWLKENEKLRELIFDNLLSLKRRGMFRADFIDRLVDRHAEGHASYFGYFIWDPCDAGALALAACGSLDENL